MQDQGSQQTDNDRKVFIGDLTFDNETDFQKISETIRKAFRDPESVLDVKVNPNRSKPGSYYAFVTLKTPEDAKKAFESENISINRNTVRVEKYAPRSDNQIYIKDVGTLSRQTLETELKSFGKVINIHLFAQSTGSNSHACTVKFQKEEDADACLRQKEMKVEGVLLKFQRNVRGDPKHEGRELFLRKIPSSNDKKQLQKDITKQLEKFGRLICPIEIEYHEENAGRSFGTAMVIYQDPASMQKARKDFNRGLLGNDLLDLDFFKNRKDRDNATCIYISQLLPSVSLDVILERIGSYGKIQNHSIYKGESRKGEKIQKGTITFENKDSVTAILSDVENPQLEQLFLNNDCKITLFLDKNDRAQYMKTIKPNRPSPQYSQQMYPMMPMMPQGMIPQGMMMSMGMSPNMQPGMGMPSMPGMMHPIMGQPMMMGQQMMGQPTMMQQRNMRPPGN